MPSNTISTKNNDSKDKHALSDYIIGCGQVYVYVDIRDRSPHESAILHNTADGLKYNTNNITPLSSIIHKFIL